MGGYSRRLAAGPVRRVDRRGVRESSAAMGSEKDGVRRGSLVRISRRRIWAGSDGAGGAGLGRAPERRAVEALRS